MTLLDRFQDEPKVIAGDWHSNTAYALQAIDCAVFTLESKIILHLGDFGVWPGESGLDYVSDLEAALAAVDAFIFVTPGNHEDYDQIDALETTEDGLLRLSDHIHLFPRGYRWVWGEKTWLSLGGAYSVDKANRTYGASWWPQETITLGDAYRAAEGGKVDVMLTHDAPGGYVVPGTGDGYKYFGVEAIAEAEQYRSILRAVVDEVKPEVLYHGHFHRRYEGVLELADKHRMKVVGLGFDGDPLNENLILVRALDHVWL